MRRAVVTRKPLNIASLFSYTHQYNNKQNHFSESNSEASEDESKTKKWR
jgi:hypothetical protein